MKNPTKFLLPLLALLFLAACGDKDENPNPRATDSEESVEEKLSDGFSTYAKETESKLAEAKAEMEAKLAAEKAKLQEEMEAQLAQETESLKRQFLASTETLQRQFDSLKAKYEEVESDLPEATAEKISDKLPELSESLNTLESLATQFSPETVDQLKEFQSEYEEELTAAKNIANEILKLFGKGSLESMFSR